jgi:hypothetical protein
MSRKETELQTFWIQALCMDQRAHTRSFPTFHFPNIREKEACADVCHQKMPVQTTKKIETAR